MSVCVTVVSWISVTPGNQVSISTHAYLKSHPDALTCLVAGRLPVSLTGPLVDWVHHEVGVVWPSMINGLIMVTALEKVFCLTIVSNMIYPMRNEYCMANLHII